ncbi:Oar protein [Acidisarcina polymorpha]|uniref:Oar protein n=1 Tax=Acidisarcina polymorpha TaxID=2211140 RepID=A0A2Z5FZK6_9BACT|nr:TonB-dependent receptor [Acidisarcina polymorpha]AXC11835.1 Oar protein [Acidisarcina polymorpha]
MRLFAFPVYSIPVLMALPLSGLFLSGVIPSAGAQTTTAQTATPASTGALRGSVTDPSGAVIPQATITATSTSGQSFSATSDSGGAYVLHGLAPGTYTIKTTAPGFSLNVTQGVTVAAGAPKHLDIALIIEVAQQNVQVTTDNPTVSTDAGSNANAVVLKDKDLDQLSDDPDELSSELTALAGPSAGPNGGQIYIDGFTAGQLPPKSAIREIRINQNPFSAEYDKLGYGRIEILTKPGTDKLHGQFFVQGTTKSFNSQNPFAQTIPDYHTVQYDGNVSSALGKKASFFFNFDRRNIQDNNIISAILNGPSSTCDPSTVNYSTYDPVTCSLALPNPRTRTNFSPRFDLQLGPKNTLTARYQYWNDNEVQSGAGQLNLPATASNEDETESTAQISDTQVISDKVVNETRFQYIHDRDTLSPVSGTPSIQVQGAFTGGGASQQFSQDNTNRYEVQNYTSLSEGSHFIKFGVRLRIDRDANNATSNYNGYYTFSQANCPATGCPTPGEQIIPALQVYQITENLLGQGFTPAQIQALGYGPKQFTVTTGTPAVTRILTDAGLYAQDDWKIKPNLTLSYGLRWESQNQISNHSDFAPRVSFAYGLARGKQPAKTVIRGGYGFFYDRFQIAQVLQAARQNGISQTQYVVTNPAFFPNFTAADLVGDNVTPTIYQVAPNLKAPYTAQTAIGVDQQITKSATVSVTYLNSRGVHALDTRNINAPLYGPNTDNSGLRPFGTNQNVYQYESAAIFKQSQLLVNFNLRAGSALSLFGFYALGTVHSDTGGVTTFPSEQYDISADYGRASFDVRQRLFLGGSYQTPRWGIRLSPFLIAFSGPPFNITTSQDLNADSIFNDRPSFAPAGQTGPNIVNTKYGNFNTAPAPGDPRIPVNSGQAPGQFNLNLRVSKTFGIGPKVEHAGPAGGAPAGGGGGGGGHGGPGFIGFGGHGGGPPGPGGTSNRRYSVTLNAQARNLFNNVNYAAPIGVVGPTFGRFTGLGGAFGGVSQSANRRIDLQAVFNF